MADRALWVVCSLVLVMAPRSGCMDDDPADPGLAVWVELASTRPDLEERVAEHAREATRRGLVPIVHLRPRWNWYLGQGYDTPEVQRAARGAYVVVIDIGMPGDASWPALNDSQCNALHQSLLALDPDGELVMPMAVPGTKEWPATSAEYAAFIGIYLERLRSTPDRVPVDLTRCVDSVVPMRLWRSG